MRAHSNFGKAWLEVVTDVLHYGEMSSPRGKRTKELLGISIKVEESLNNLLVHPVRDLNYRFAVAEFFWITAGLEVLEPLARYNSRMREFSDDGQILAGAYGPRLMPQIEYVLRQLRKPESRQAVATIWTPNPAASKDIPCTLSYQFLSRAGKIHGIVTMRSSDLWLGLPYDFYTFSQILNAVAGEIGLDPGSLTMQLGSAHLYEEHWHPALVVIQRPLETETVSSRTLPGLGAPKRLINALNGQGCWDVTAYCDLTTALQRPTKAQALEVLRAATQ